MNCSLADVEGGYDNNENFRKIHIFIFLYTSPISFLNLFEFYIK